MPPALFDTWTDQYDRWFTTPTGRLVYRYESALLLELLDPRPGELILDVGCGTGLFTREILNRGATVVGIDLSIPMLTRAIVRSDTARFTGLCADMCALPFGDACFDRVYSMTAIEFVAEADRAVAEFDRVTCRGGCIVVTTLNSLSPWATRRKQTARQKGHSLFAEARFRSPEEMRAMVPADCLCATAVHFRQDDPVSQIPELERRGAEQGSPAGALLAVRWLKG